MNNTHFWLIAGMAVVTFLPRFLPVVALTKHDISPQLARWMSYIPVTIFAALVASDIFFWEESFNLNPVENIKIIPSILVFFIAYKSKSMLASMVCGIIGITLMWMFV